MRKAGWTMIFLFSAAAFGAPPEAEIERRVNALVSRMTLEEKLGQMSQSTSMATLTDSIR